MTKDEQRIYKLELNQIREHFEDLRPRPIRIVQRSSYNGKADEPFLKIHKRLLANGKEKELSDTLKHELLHYELKDGGKEYHGHGKAFLKHL